jgi:hypothetical protein
MKKQNSPKISAKAKIIGGVALVVVLGAVVLLVPKEKSSTDNDQTNTTNDNTSDNSSSSQNGIKINLADNNNYYAVVEGKKYTVNTTIQNIMDDGYTVSESGTNLNQVLEPGKYLLNTVQLLKDGNYDTYFPVLPINRTKKPLTVAESSVFSMDLNDTLSENITIVGGITFGKTIEEVEAVFGVPTKKEDNLAKPGETVVSYYQETESQYTKYKADGNFAFYFNTDGKLYTIIMRSNKE